MKTILIGNDMSLSWTLTAQDGSAYVVEGKPLSLYRVGFGGRTRITGISASGNVVRWSWLGREQQEAGRYSFVLVVNEGQDDMHTVEAMDVIRLVSPGSGAGGCIPDCGGCACGVEVESVCIGSTVEVLSGEAVLSKSVRRIVTLTQAEYDSLEVKDTGIMYVITEETGDAAE